MRTDGQLTGFLLLRAQRAAGAFDGTHSCGFLSQGGDPPPSMAAWPAREATGRAERLLIAREVCLVCVWGDKAKKEGGKVQLTERKEVTKSGRAKAESRLVNVARNFGAKSRVLHLF